jgi:hypothetical protein
MENINFQPVFDYIDQKVDELKTDLKNELASKSDVNNIQISLDGYAKQSKDYYQEVTVLIAKVNRMEQWIQRVAEKVGVEYKV